MKRKLVVILILFSFVVAFPSVNGDGTPVDYSKIGLSARYWGMGKMGAAFSDDSGAILLNPAGLAGMRSFEMSSMSTQVLGEFNYSLFNVIYPREDETIGLSLLYEDAGTIYASETLDALGHPQKEDKIENYNRLFTFAYGRKVFLDNLYVGGALKYLQKKISFVESNSAALDLGVIYKWDRELSFGFVAKNAMQGGITYSNGAAGVDNYETEYIVGVAWSLFEKDLTFGVDYHTGPFGRTNVGVEYWWDEIVAFRGGVNEGAMTVGMGLRLQDWQFDYGHRYLEAPLDNQIYFSLTYGNARKSELTRPVIYLLDEDNY